MRAALLLATLPAVLAAPALLDSFAQSRDQVPLGLKSQAAGFSGDVTQCQGYKVDSVSGSSTGGISAQLSILDQCNAYGTDIPSLTLSVEYETAQRLHVHIYDTPLHQYQLDDSILPRPQRTLSGGDAVNQSELEFGYDNNPFAFWVTRKSDGEVLFDTRAKNIPTYTDQVQIEGNYSNWTVLPAHPLVFEDQYLQISSALPTGANIYGLGEVISGSGYRRNSSGTVQTFWARDIGDPVDENVYGSHAMYMESRWDDNRKKSASHGVFLLNSNGMDVILRDGVIEYRAIGGTLDFYFLSGPTPNDVASQYALTVGLPQAMPFWSFGFHLCRWGYTSINETRGVVQKMRDAGIPLETQWNDIDWMRHYREFQFDQNYSPDEYKGFVDELHSNNQHYIMIIDAAVGILYNDTDQYDFYQRGHELDVWTKNPDGTEYIGSVWPGYTVFPDWFSPNMQQVWTEAFSNHSQIVDFDGVWLDMNEPSSFIDGSASNSTKSLNQTLLQPDPTYVPPQLPAQWPEGYWNVTSGISGNITVNGTLTYGANGTAPKNDALRRDLLSYLPSILRRHFEQSRRTVEIAQARDHVVIGKTVRHNVYANAEAEAKRSFSLDPIQDQVMKRQIGGYIPTIPNVDVPAYPIRNGDGTLRLSHNCVSPNATHANGLQEYSVHNVWGTMEEMATNEMLQTLKPGLRPFIVGRSSFAGIGRKSAHWLGDNYSTWAYMKRAIQGVLQFNLFAIPMVGPDTCGFNGNTDEELCNRWMQLSAFFPFFRNHNTKGAISQEPFVWDSVASASIKAIQARYAMLPYWLTLFAEASQYGIPPVRALFYEFDDPSLYANDVQFLVGPSVIVTSVLQPNESTTTGIFPSADGTTWTDWWTHQKVDTSKSDNVTLDLPLGEIGVHVRSGSVLLLHSNPGYTLTETREGGYEVLVVLDGKGYAEGTAKIDDGVSLPVGDQTCLNFTATNFSCLNSSPTGSYNLQQPLTKITILGVTSQPSGASLNGQDVSGVEYKSDTEEVVLSGLNGDLNQAWELKWW